MTPFSIVVLLDADSHERLLDWFPPLYRNVRAHHVTVKYDPDADDLEFLRRMEGTPVKVDLLSYHEDDDAQAVRVEIPDYLERRANRISHVTISTAEDVPAVYSNELIREPGEAVSGTLWGIVTGLYPKVPVTALKAKLLR